MQLNKIIDDYVVSEQITVDDIQTIKEAGFKTIFCNRPENEEINQVTVESIKNAALKNGLKFIHQPVIGGQITQVDVDQFSEYFDASEKPIFAYCRTGTRSSMLWALSESGKRSVEDILTMTSKAGYNLNNLFL
ncbi:TIGR01244 family sulfur transferase [Methylophilaceae bacterium]|nr:TIGR01244 family sulfur transferase [Methylophilaceae bacterium]